MKPIIRASILVLSMLVICAPSPLRAQTANSGASATSKAALTVEDVVKLSKAGLSDDVIVQQIQKSGQSFDLSTDQLIRLKSSGVSDRVVKTMLDPGKGSTALGVATAPTIDPTAPTEIGVYTRKLNTDTWVEVLPEVVNWKTGGVLKSMATGGIVKGDVNGHVTGLASRNSVTTTNQFLIIAPEGVAVTEYQLLHLRPSGDSREFRTVTGGVFHVSGGATRDLVEFDSKKNAPRQYLISLPPSVKTGEYGFLPPGAVGSSNGAGSQGKLYSIHVIE